jgi:hypothetical protein
MLLFFILGIPLSYIGLLYSSKQQMGALAVETDLVYMLYKDYTSNCW